MWIGWGQQTSKGTMWRSIGLDDGLFNVDEETEISGITPAVVAMAQDPAGSKAKPRALVRQHQQQMMATLKKFA